MLRPEDVSEAVSDLVRFPERTIPSRIDLEPVQASQEVTAAGMSSDSRRSLDGAFIPCHCCSRRRTPSVRDQFLEVYEEEHARPLVLHTFPKERAGLRPHPKSKTALELAWMFVTRPAPSRRR